MRDLTDAEQNASVLDLASALLSGGGPDEAAGAAADGAGTGAGGRDPMGDDRGPGASLLAEARACARSRSRLAGVGRPVHLSVVWAMYGETGRIARCGEHPHGEDLVREKVRQLEWLTAGLPVTWSALAVDDGCPDVPSSADAMAAVVAAEGWPSSGPGSVRVLRLADVLADVAAGRASVGPAFDRLTSTSQSRKGGSVLAGLAEVASGLAPRAVADAPPSERPFADGPPVDAPPSGGTAPLHVVAYTDADLSANLGQLGALVAAIADAAPGAGEGSGASGGRVVAALGQRYGMRGAVLVKPDGPWSEPRSTGDKPDKLIVLLRHAVRATLVPPLAHVLDTQAGFKAFDAEALAPVLPLMSSFDETFDVELLVHLAHWYGPAGLAVEPIVFTEDFAATNFPSVDPGERHLAMVRQVVELYDRLVAPVDPVAGEAAELLDLVRGLDLPAYVRVVEGLRRLDPGDPTLFDRRWPVTVLRELAAE